MLLIKYYVVSKEIYSRQRIVMFLGRRKYATLKQRKTFPLFFAKNIFGVKISKKCRIVFSQINLFEKSCEKVSCKWGRFNYNWKNYIFYQEKVKLTSLNSRQLTHKIEPLSSEEICFTYKKWASLSASHNYWWQINVGGRDNFLESKKLMLETV